MRRALDVVICVVWFAPLLLLLVSLYASNVATAIALTIALVAACDFCVVVMNLVQANLLLPW